MAAGRDRRLKAIERRLVAIGEKTADIEGTRALTAVLEIPEGLDLTTTKGKAWLSANLPETPCAALPARLSEDQWLRHYGQ